MINIWKLCMYVSICNSNWSCFQFRKRFFPQVLLEECRCKIKERETKSLIVDHIESSSDVDSSDDDSSDEKDGIDHPSFVDDAHDPLDVSPLGFR